MILNQGVYFGLTYLWDILRIEIGKFADEQAKLNQKEDIASVGTINVPEEEDSEETPASSTPARPARPARPGPRTPGQPAPSNPTRDPRRGGDTGTSGLDLDTEDIDDEGNSDDM